MRLIQKKQMSKKMKQRLLILSLETTGIIGFVVAAMIFVIRLGAMAKGEMPADSERLMQDLVGLGFGIGGLMSFICLACFPLE